MRGPKSQLRISLDEGGPNELIWITGYRTEIVTPDGEARLSDGFMCHANLSFARLADHRQRFGDQVRSRLFTLSQGQMDVRFPDGFGIPVASKQEFYLLTQVLNLNPIDAPIDLRHRMTVEYIRDIEVTTPVHPLITFAAQGMVSVDGASLYFGQSEADPDEHGPGCAVAEPAGSKVFEDGLGGSFAAHWVVQPGREENRSLVTNYMRLPFDTTAHFIAVHLHPFAESAELYDLTEDRSVFLSRASQSPSRVGLAKVESFSSAEGIPLYASHEYELRSVYENTTLEEQDSMAVMFLYVLDHDFHRPDLLAKR